MDIVDMNSLGVCSGYCLSVVVLTTITSTIQRMLGTTPRSSLILIQSSRQIRTIMISKKHRYFKPLEEKIFLEF